MPTAARRVTSFAECMLLKQSRSRDKQKETAFEDWGCDALKINHTILNGVLFLSFARRGKISYLTFRGTCYT